MTDRDRADRLRVQFGDTDRPDASSAIWDALDLVLETDRFLNIGYSPWYCPHVVGSSQRRLAMQLGRRLALRLGYSAGVPLLDVGCGRGGPSLDLAQRFGYEVTGIDLVGHNVALARQNAVSAGVDAAFLVGDAERLPVESDSVRACVVVDAAQYIADKQALLSELARVLEPGGVLALSDLVRTPGSDRETVDAFADAWDMAPLTTLDRYRSAVAECGFVERRYEDVTAHSVGRFGVWTELFLALERTPMGAVAARMFSPFGVDLDAVTEQVEVTRPALPSLRHLVVSARFEGA